MQWKLNWKEYTTCSSSKWNVCMGKKNDAQRKHCIFKSSKSMLVIACYFYQIKSRAVMVCEITFKMALIKTSTLCSKNLKDKITKMTKVNTRLAEAKRFDWWSWKLFIRYLAKILARSFILFWESLKSFFFPHCSGFLFLFAPKYIGVACWIDLVYVHQKSLYTEQMERSTANEKYWFENSNTILSVQFLC